MFTTVLALLPRAASGKGQSREEQIGALVPIIPICILWYLLSIPELCFKVLDLLKKIPSPWEIESVMKRLVFVNFQFFVNYK